MRTVEGNWNLVEGKRKLAEVMIPGPGQGHGPAGVKGWAAGRDPGVVDVPGEGHCWEECRYMGCR